MIKESACNAGDLRSILGWEDSLEKGVATHYSILVWRIPQAMEPSRLQSMVSQRVGHDWLSLHPTTPGRSRDSKMHKMIPALQQLHSPVFWNQRIYSLNISFLICKTGSVQFSCLAMSDSATPSTAAHHASLAIINSRSLPKLISIESVMPSNHLILCHPFLLLPSIFPSIWVSPSHQVAKVLEFQLQHQSFQWLFRTDFL